MRTIIAVGGSHRSVETLKADCDCEFISQPDNTPIPQFFNQVVADNDADVFGFFRPNDSFTEGENLSKIIRHLYEHVDFGSCYTDIIMNNGTSIYNPSYDIRICKTNIIINTPLFIKSNIIKQIQFNEKLSNLYIWELIRRLGQMSFMIHIPYPIITSKTEYANISKDLKIINDT